MFWQSLEKIKKDVPLQKISEPAFVGKLLRKIPHIITFYEKNC